MWIIGAGIMIGGLLSMAFSPMSVGFTVIGIGALLLIPDYVEEKQKERRENEWRKMYPSYKY